MCANKPSQWYGLIRNKGSKKNPTVFPLQNNPSGLITKNVFLIRFFSSLSVGLLELF
jgi:hypothetical protein